MRVTCIVGLVGVIIPAMDREQKPLKNARQEAYCRGRAAGMTQGDSYKDAGFKVTSDSSARIAACRLETDVNIQRRIRQIQTDMTDMAAIGPGWVVSRLVHEAQTSESPGARVRAVELLGKVNRLFVDVIQTPAEQTMTDEDLARSIAGSDDVKYNRMLVFLRNITKDEAA